MLGEKWKTLSEKQRQPYEAKAAADKKRYEEQKLAYAVRFVVNPSTPSQLTMYRMLPRRRRRSLSRPSTSALILSRLAS